MNNTEAHKIEEEFNNNLNNLIKKEEAENKVLTRLIIFAFAISLVFILLCAFISIRNYGKMKDNNSKDNYVTKVKVEEYEVE